MFVCFYYCLYCCYLLWQHCILVMLIKRFEFNLIERETDGQRERDKQTQTLWCLHAWHTWGELPYCLPLFTLTSLLAMLPFFLLFFLPLVSFLVTLVVVLLFLLASFLQFIVWIGRISWGWGAGWRGWRGVGWTGGWSERRCTRRRVCRGRCVNCPTVICIYNIIQNTIPNALLTMMIQLNSHTFLSTFTFIKTFSFTDSSNRDLISWTDVSAVNQCYRYYLPGINCTCVLFG